VLLSYEADTAAFHGQLENARELSRGAITSARRSGEKETAAGYQAEAAIREALFGDFAEARKQAANSLAQSISREVETRAAFALALAGGAAERVASDLSGRFPEDTMVQFIFLPVIRAQLALNHREAAQAIRELEASAPFELGNASPMEEFPFALYPCYLRGNAFLASNKGKEAASEFQKILDHRSIVMNEPIGALAYKGLARAYALMGERDRAQALYREFLSLWHDADMHMPILQKAKLDYASLRGRQ
jgi:tetratricopeptide (TPR) repeat protein